MIHFDKYCFANGLVQPGNIGLFLAPTKVFGRSGSNNRHIQRGPPKIIAGQPIPPRNVPPSHKSGRIKGDLLWLAMHGNTRLVKGEPPHDDDPKGWNLMLYSKRPYGRSGEKDAKTSMSIHSGKLTRADSTARCKRRGAALSLMMRRDDGCPHVATQMKI